MNMYPVEWPQEYIIKYLMPLINVAYGEDKPTYLLDTDMFTIRPHRETLECTCGWNEIDHHHRRILALTHRPHCFRHDYIKLWAKRGKKGFSEKDYYKELRALYKKHGVEPYTGDDHSWWWGCATKCTCDYNERVEAIYDEYAKEFGHKGHKPDCQQNLPNFLHKPSGYALKWNTSPLFGVNANYELDEWEIRNLMLASLRYYLEEVSNETVNSN